MHVIMLPIMSSTRVYLATKLTDSQTKRKNKELTDLEQFMFLCTLQKLLLNFKDSNLEGISNTFDATFQKNNAEKP